MMVVGISLRDKPKNVSNVTVFYQKCHFVSETLSPLLCLSF